MTTAADPVFDPFAPGFTEDPYPQYARQRESRPVERHELGFWALWRHADVDALLRARLSVEDRNASGSGPLQELYQEVYGPDEARRRGGLSMLDRDPPDHTRLRRLVSSGFTPRRVEELTPQITGLVDEALDRLADRGGGNLIDLLAFPLPFNVISVMLGMPEVDHDRLRNLSHHVVRSLEPVVDPDELRAIQAADEELGEMTAEAIRWKRKNPADDLLTALIQAESDGDVLTDDELVAQVILLYLAGHETTVNLIGNGTLALLRHPGEADRLRADPGIDEQAVEELLRYDSPVQMSRRITLAPYPVRGVEIPKGAFVIASLGSANRDPEVFGPDADRVRLDRPEARSQLSFGAGVHHCLGASLAKLEGRLAIGRLFRRFPGLCIAGEPVWNGRINLRGMTELPVSCS
jgi:cytochrome P450